MKVLIISDLHLAEYPSSSFYDLDFRLKTQPMKLAERILELSKTYEISEFWILGDLIDKPLPSPKVLHVLKLFFSKILENEKLTIRFILGQHDLTTRKIDHLDQEQDSFVTLISNDRIIYSHDQTLNLSGRSIYFSNYSKNPIYPKSKVDIFCSHIPLGFVKLENQDKYDLGIHGDIHTEFSDGKNYSVCTPYQHKYYEFPEGRIGLLDLKSLSFQRLPSDSNNFEFLKLLAPERSNPISLKKEDNFNSKDLIKSILESENLLKIHQDVLKNIDINGFETDRRFKITNLSIRNFRSIEELDLDFSNKGKVIYLVGSNGSGKSSVMRAIKTVFLGDRYLKDQVTLGSNPKDFSLEISFQYLNQLFSISRRLDSVRFFCEGHEISSHTKTGVDQLIRDHLPFLKIFEFFNIDHATNFFHPSVRLDLFTEMFKLSDWEKCFEEAANQSQKIKSELDDLDQEIHKINAGVLIDCDIPSDFDVNFDYNKKIKDLEENKSKVADLIHQLILKNSLDEKIDTLKASIPAKRTLDPIGIESRLESIKNTLLKSSYGSELDQILCNGCKEKISKEFISKNQLEELKQEKESLTREIEKENLVKTQLDQLGVYKKDLLRFKGLEGFNLDDQKSKLEEISQQIFSLKTKLDQAEMLKEKEVLKKGLIELMDKKILERDKKREEYNDLKRYQSMFDFSNLESIPYKILGPLSETLNTENIKFKTFKELKNGKIKLDISSSIRVGKNWIDYSSASSGQRSYLDLLILDSCLKLLGGFGVIILDESLTNLDSDKYLEISDIISNLEADQIIVSSHNPLFGGYDSRINFQLAGGFTQLC